MGTRGPVPKRSTAQAGHRTSAEQPDRPQVPGEIHRPSAAGHWHRQARAWYRSLGQSGQSRYYEPSDWQQARVLAEMLSQLLLSPKPSSEMFKAWLAGAEQLGSTEGARRRMRIEVQRVPDEPATEDGKVAVMDRYRQALG